jgi:hypothetical protein
MPACAIGGGSFSGSGRFWRIASEASEGLAAASGSLPNSQLVMPGFGIHVLLILMLILAKRLGF